MVRRYIPTSTPQIWKNNDSTWNIRLFWYTKHLLFWKNLIWMLWLIQTFMWKATVCSAPYLAPLEAERVQWPQLTPRNRSTTRLSLFFWWLYQNKIWPTISHLFTDTTILVFPWGVFVASWGDAWLYCEWAEGARWCCGMTFPRARPLPVHSMARDPELSSFSQSICSYPTSVCLL